MNLPLIIIGAGLAGWTTIREFRKLDPDTAVTLITADSGDFYAKPTLSNAFAQQRGPSQLVTTPAARMAETLKVTLLAHTEVLAIDPAQNLVRTGQGELTYRDLVLATGAHAIRLSLAGDAAEHVLSVNSLDDFAAFHARLLAVRAPEAAKARVLIMGAGLIGCEFANDLAGTGHPVQLVDPASAPIAALLPAQASAQLKDALTGLGVQWHFGTTVTAVDQATAGDTASGAMRVTLANGQRLEADLVLSAIGLRANTTLAQAAGLQCERGVVVDASLRSSQPHIYALGDNAQYAGQDWDQATNAPVSGGRTLPYVMPIMNAAKALAATLTGTRTELVFPLMPVGIKTPALPIVVAPPPPGTAGEWHSTSPGVWQFRDPDHQVRGFVLTGAQTNQRMAQSKLVVP
jgi:rubredoxin-NAD+ reductase